MADPIYIQEFSAFTHALAFAAGREDREYFTTVDAFDPAYGPAYIDTVVDSVPASQVTTTMRETLQRRYVADDDSAVACTLLHSGIELGLVFSHYARGCIVRFVAITNVPHGA